MRNPSANGTWATTAATWGSRAAVSMTWPPENEVPQSATRVPSISDRERAKATAAAQSASWRPMSSSWRGWPELAPKWR